MKYNADMEIYLSCIKGEYDAKVAAEADATAEQKAEMASDAGRETQRRGQGTDRVTDRFNEQLRAWKAKNAAGEEDLLIATPRARGQD